MEAHQFPQAFAQFQTACIMLPDSDTGCLNSGIALLAMNQYDDARRILATSVARNPQSALGWYNLGLLNRAQGRTSDALAAFQKVAALDPNDADTHCLIGLSYLHEKQYRDAFTAFQAALKLDPLNATAESGATEALAGLGAAANTHSGASSNELANSPLNLQPAEAYSKQGKYSLAAELPSPGNVGPAITAHFVDVTRESGLLSAPRPRPARGAYAGANPAKNTPEKREIRSMADYLGSGACVFDYDGDGRPDIFLVDSDGNGNAALYRNLGHGRFVNVTRAAKIAFHGEGMGCAVGDYDNDGRPDLAVSFDGGVRLYHNTGIGAFADATASSGIRIDGLAMGLSFVDYDRDGNLDLYVTRFRNSPLQHPLEPFAVPQDDSPGNTMWRNNGNDTFSDVTATLGLAGNSSGTGVIASELTGNGGINLLLTGMESAPSLLLNNAEGAYKNAAWWGAETQGPTAGGVAFDFNKDGYMDVALTHWQPAALGLWRNEGGTGFRRVALPDPGWMRAWGIASLDYDNDGWIDLVAVGDTFSGEGRIALLRNEGDQGFHDVTPDTSLDKIVLHDPRSVIALDADGDGSTYLLITQNRRPPVLLKEIARSKHNWLQIAVQATTQNRMGIGVPVKVFSGALRQSWEIPGASGYLSQGPALISAGLGDDGAADSVSIHWQKDTVEVKLHLPAGRKMLISQKDAANTP